MNPVIIGNATLYLGDCLDILPGLPKVDAVITDPPYGIGEDHNNVASRQRRAGGNSSALADQRDYGHFDWDSSPASPESIRHIQAASKWQAIFGGNYFDLPPTSCWLVWDKQNGSNDFADCELAWTNWPKAARRIQWRWNGMIRQGNESRFHPTQKPLGVMRWVIDLCPASQTILDPYMGSGTTGVACMQMGRQFIGIEKEPKYFDIACRRIEQAQRQPDMFIEPKPALRVEQASLFAAA